MDYFIYTDGCSGTINEVNYVEQVETVVTILTSIRGNLEIYLISPRGTKSLLLPVSRIFMSYLITI